MTVVSRTHASVVISFYNSRKERGLFPEPSIRYTGFVSMTFLPDWKSLTEIDAFPS